MRHLAIVAIILFFMTGCKLFSNNDGSSERTLVNHKINAEIPLICEGYPGGIGVLTEKLLSKIKFDSLVKRSIHDSVVFLFSTGAIMTNTCYVDEIYFSKEYFGQFDLRDEDAIEKITITIARDLSEMKFHKYGLMYPSDAKIKVGPVNGALNKWDIIADGIERRVVITEDSKTKALLFKNQEGQEIKIEDVKPSRTFLSDINYIMSATVEMKNSLVFTDSVKSERNPLSQLVRFAENDSLSRMY